MKFSHNLAYGLSFLHYLASHEDQGWIMARQIAKNQSLPEAYCQKILHSLARAELVAVSARGYKLAKSMESINVWDVIEAFTWEPTPAARNDRFSMRLYENLRQRTNRMLAGLTLDEIINSLEAKLPASPRH